MSGANRDSMKKTLLIAEVKKYPVLYSTTHPRYRDNVARDVAWDKISETLNSPREACRHEWKILRDSLRQALRSKKSNRKGEQSAPWYYESHMSFLLPHITKRENNKPRFAKTDESKLLMDIQSDKVEVSTEEEQHLQEIEDSTWRRTAEGRRSWKNEDADTDELFYAGVCAAARSLDLDLQRELRRKVLMALFDAETEQQNRR